MKWLDRFLKSVNIYFLNFYLSHLIRKFPFWFFFQLHTCIGTTHPYMCYCIIFTYGNDKRVRKACILTCDMSLNLTAWFGNTVNSNLNIRNHKEVIYKNFSSFSCNLTQHGRIAELITCAKYGISSVKFTNLCNPYWMDTAMLVHYF